MKEREREREQMQGDRPLEGKKGEEENLWFSCLINWDVLLLLQCRGRTN
jgi:hypothetical protein